MICFGEDGLAGDPWWWMQARLVNSPRVVLIALPPQGDKEGGVNDGGVFHSHWISGILSYGRSCRWRLPPQIRRDPR